MLEAYSLDAAVAPNTAIPFNNVTLDKGCSERLSGPSTIQLDKCGVYKVSFDGTAEASTTVQLFKDGVAQPQAQSTGTTLGFETLVQVPSNNTCCPCSSPVRIQVLNVGTAEATLSANIVVVRQP